MMNIMKKILMKGGMLLGLSLALAFSMQGMNMEESHASLDDVTYDISNPITWLSVHGGVNQDAVIAYYSPQDNAVFLEGNGTISYDKFVRFAQEINENNFKDGKQWVGPEKFNLIIQRTIRKPDVPGGVDEKYYLNIDQLIKDNHAAFKDFKGNIEFRTLDNGIGQIQAKKTAASYYAFENSKVDLSGFDMHEFERLRAAVGMFKNATIYSDVNIVAPVLQYMNSMFENAKCGHDLKIKVRYSGIDEDEVSSGWPLYTKKMFYGAKNFSSIDLKLGELNWIYNNNKQYNTLLGHYLPPIQEFYGYKGRERLDKIKLYNVYEINIQPDQDVRPWYVRRIAVEGNVDGNEGDIWKWYQKDYNLYVGHDEMYFEGTGDIKMPYRYTFYPGHMAVFHKDSSNGESGTLPADIKRTTAGEVSLPGVGNLAKSGGWVFCGWADKPFSQVIDGTGPYMWHYWKIGQRYDGQTDGWKDVSRKLDLENQVDLYPLWGRKIKFVKPAGVTGALPGGSSSDNLVETWERWGGNFYVPGDARVLAKDNYVFKCWNTQEDGNGVDWGPGTSNTHFNGKTELTLYPKFVKAVIYNKGWGEPDEKGIVPEYQLADVGDTVVIEGKPGSLRLRNSSNRTLTLISWNSKPNFKGLHYGPFKPFISKTGILVTPTRNYRFTGSSPILHLYSYWGETIKFHPNNGTGGGTGWEMKKSSGTKAGTGTAPEDIIADRECDVLIPGNPGDLTGKNGETFACWNTKRDGSGDDYGPGTDKPYYREGFDVDLYAKYGYRIKYHKNGADVTGSAPNDQIGNKGDTLTIENRGNMEREGYSFLCWNTQENGQGDNYGPNGYRDGSYEMVDPSKTYRFSDQNGSLDLYAKWGKKLKYNAATPIGYKVDGEVPESQFGIVGDSVTIQDDIGNLTITQLNSGKVRIFVCWNDKFDGSGTNYGPGTSHETYTFGDNETLYAKWGYKVTYHKNAVDVTGEVPEVQTGALGDKVTIAGKNKLKRNGYVFMHWNTIANGSGTKYGPYEYRDGNYTKVEPKKEYTFVEPNAFGFDYDNHGSIDLYAQWGRKLTYDANGQGEDTSGAVPEPQYNFFGGGVTVQENVGDLAKGDQDFVGWNTQPDGQGLYYGPNETLATYTFGNNITLYAQYGMRIKYFKNGDDVTGQVPEAQKGLNNQTVTIEGNTGNLAKDGFTFLCWNTKEDGTGENYGPEGYKNENYEDVVPMDNYTFNTDENKKSLDLYAKWGRTVTYNANAQGEEVTGSVPDFQGGLVGSTMVIVDNPGNLKKGEKSFIGWNTEADGTGTAYGPTTSNEGYTFGENITLYAQYGMRVKYFKNGDDVTGTVPADQRGVTGDTVTIEDNDSLDYPGYSFICWNTKANGTGIDYGPTPYRNENYELITPIAEYQFDSPGQENLDLYAKWGRTLSYSNNPQGGTVTGETPETQYTLIGTAITVQGNIGDLMKGEQEFVGWNSEADGSGIDYGPDAKLTTYTPGADMILYAQYGMRVKYHKNGDTVQGVVPEEQKGTAGQTVNISGKNGLSNEGYTFLCWNTKPDGSGDNYGPAEMTYTNANYQTITPTATFTFSTPENTKLDLYAQWGKKVLYVKNEQGGEVTGDLPMNQYDLPGKTVTIQGNPGDLKKGDEAFIGWNSQADGEGLFYGPNELTKIHTFGQDLVLYAQYGMRVKYFKNGDDVTGDVPEEQPGKTGENVAIQGHGNLAKDGYEFLCWNTQPDGQGVNYGLQGYRNGQYEFVTVEDNYLFNPPQNNSLNLYAIWGRKLTYDRNAGGEVVTGNLPDSQFGMLGSEVQVQGNPGDLAKGDQMFTGWNTEPDGSGIPYGPNETLTAYTFGKNVTLYAQYGMRVKYHKNGEDVTGTVPAEQKGVAGDTVEISGNSNLEKPGYELLCWNTSADGTGTDYGPTGYRDGSYTQITPTTTFTFNPPQDSKLDLFAKWGRKVTYDKNPQGEVVSGNLPEAQFDMLGSSVTIQGNVGNLIKGDKAFVGWNTQPDGSGKAYGPGTNNETYTFGESTTLYAQYGMRVKYFKNGKDVTGTVPQEQTGVANETVTIADKNDLDKPGYTFLCWNTEADGSGDNYGPAGYIDGTAGTIPTTKTYTFNPPQNGKLDLYAKWGKMVSYDANAQGGTITGSVPETQYDLLGATVNIQGNPLDLKKDGQKVTSWNTEADGSGVSYGPNEQNTTYNFGDNLVLYAQYGMKVRYFKNGEDVTGQAPADQIGEANETVNIAGQNGLARTGYTFLCWNTQADGLGQDYGQTSYVNGNYDEVIPVGTFTFNPPQNSKLDLFAKWGKKVTYDENAQGQVVTGNVPDTQYGVVGQDAIIQGNVGDLVRGEDQFGGWNTKPDGTGTSYGPNTGATTYTFGDNITLYAQYGLKVHYEANGAVGDVPADQKGEVGGSVQLSDQGNLTKDGFVFVRWNTQASGHGDDYNPGQTYTFGNALTLYAQWGHTISYDANGADSGSVPSGQNEIQGRTVVVRGNDGGLAKDGETQFVCWNTQANGLGTNYGEGTENTRILMGDSDRTLYAKWGYRILYRANGGEGTPPNMEIFSQGQTVNIAGSGTLTSPDAVFLNWNTQADGKGTAYNPGQGYTGSSMILYADWVPHIIPDNDGQNQRPGTHVTVTFDGGDHGELVPTDEHIYYVYPKAEPRKLVEDLGKPGVHKVEKGWKHIGWSVKDDEPIEGGITIEAKYQKIDEDIIPDDNGQNEKPEGYVVVIFSAGEHGQIKAGEETTYYVNPNAEPEKLKYVDVPTPQLDKIEKGWKFAGWNVGEDEIVVGGRTIKAKYVKKEDAVADIIPDNNGQNEKPDGYVVVTFSSGEHGDIKAGEETIYYVNPNAEPDRLRYSDVPTPQLENIEEGWKFAGWDLAQDEFVTGGKNIKANYVEDKEEEDDEDDNKDDVINDEDGDGTPPEGYVTVTFAQGDHGKINGLNSFYVKKTAGMTVGQLPAPQVTADKGWQFDGWSSNSETVVTDGMIITAQYKEAEEGDVIENEDGEDNPPAGYVTVTFAQGDHGTINGISSFYIKKEAGMKVSQIAAPQVVAEDGWQFDGWDTAGDTLIADGITITATYKEAEEGDVINDEDGDGTPPEGYVTVTFAQGDHGTINGISSFYVKKEAGMKVSQIAAPQVVAEKGWQFDGWDTSGDTLIADGITITATYKEAEEGDVIDDEDGDGTPPEGYVTVTFAQGAHGTINGISSFYIKKTAGMTVSQIAAPQVVAEDGWQFDGWDTAGDTLIADGITITAQYKEKEKDDVINDEDGDGTPPEGYVTVTFAQGDHGTISGISSFYIKKTAGKTVEQLPAPQVVAEKGWQFAGWDKSGNTPIVDGMTITATYKEAEKDDVINDEDGDGTPPEGYVTVTFAQGDHGTINGLKSFYVKKEAGKTVGQLPAPQVVVEDGWLFDGWDKDADTPVGDGITITATYKENVDNDVINDENGDGTPPEGYVTVTFAQGDHGTLSGVTSFYVKTALNKTVGQLPAPQVAPEDGWQFDGWDQATDKVITEGITITAQYKRAAETDVITDEDGDGTPPEGYVTVTFAKGAHGQLSGAKSFYVKVSSNTTIGELAAPQVVAEDGWQFNGWNADGGITIQGAMTIVATYKPASETDVITDENGEDNPPAGYVTVTFAKGAHGQLNGITSFYVKVASNKTVGQLSAPQVVADNGWQFMGWNTDENITITKGMTITATYKQKTGTDVITDETGENNPPEGFVTVTFNKGDHGQLNGAKSFYVKVASNKTVGQLTAPQVVADNGWQFDGWDKTANTTITQGMTITATYKQKTGTDVITDETGENNPPEGFVTVTFNKGAHGQLNGATHFYVRVASNKTVGQLTAPQVVADNGWQFDGWNTDENITITKGMTITAGYVPVAGTDVITDTNGEDNPPEGFVTVTFDKGDHGNLNGVAHFYVRVASNKTVGQLTAPQVVAEDGWQFDGWDKASTTTINAGMTITAKYKESNGNSNNNNGDVIDNPNGEDNPPTGYVTVTFNKGEHGRLSGVANFYVRVASNKTVSDLTAPQVTPDNGYKFVGWTKAGNTPIQSGMVITATYQEKQAVDPDIVPDDGSGVGPAGFVKVEFTTGTHGTLNGTKVYFVNPNANPQKTVGDLSKPAVVAEDGWKHTGWNVSDSDTITAGMNIDPTFVQKTSYTVSYNASGGSGTLPSRTMVYDGDTIKLPSKGNLGKSKSKFLGWTFGGKVYSAGASFVVTGDTKFYAKWKKKKSNNNSGNGGSGHSGSGSSGNNSNNNNNNGNGNGNGNGTGNGAGAGAGFGNLVPGGPIYFEDVPSYEWFNDAIYDVARKGLMNGTDPGKFSPFEPTTRAMIVTTLYRMSNEGPVSYNLTFPDVPSNEWYTEAIKWGMKNGVVKGYEEGYFGPDEIITRQQLAAVIYRYSQYKSYNTQKRNNLYGFYDRHEIYPYALQPIQWTVAEGLIKGVEPGQMGPTMGTIRAELAMLLSRYSNKYGYASNYGYRR